MKFETGSSATRQIAGSKVSSSHTVIWRPGMPTAKARRCSSAKATTVASSAALICCCVP
jgi:hypothetical protein